MLSNYQILVALCTALFTFSLAIRLGFQLFNY